MTGLIREVSVLGQPSVAAALVVASVVALLVLRRRVAVLFVALTATAIPLTLAIKAVVASRRPGAAAASGLLGRLDQYSFPSGHVVFVVVFFGFAAWLARRHLTGAARWAVVALAAAAMVLIGPSRLALGVHRLEDVVAGYPIGAAWLALLVAGYERTDTRYGKARPISRRFTTSTSSR